MENKKDIFFFGNIIIPEMNMEVVRLHREIKENGQKDREFENFAKTHGKDRKFCSSCKFPAAKNTGYRNICHEFFFFFISLFRI